jgi:hypothetical protein
MAGREQAGSLRRLISAAPHALLVAEVHRPGSAARRNARGPVLETDPEGCPLRARMPRTRARAASKTQLANTARGRSARRQDEA